MIPDIGRRQRRTSIAGVTSSRTRRKLTSLGVEPLEERQLLSFYTGPTASRPILSGGTFFTSTVSGGGFERIHRMGHGQVEIDLIGTNSNSALTITAQTDRGRFSNSPLTIGKINVETGLLGAIDASAANLVGPVSTLNNSVSSLQFNSIASNARINIQGNLGSFGTPVLNLGPTGLFSVAGQLTGSLGGSITVNGGQLFLGSESTGTFSPASLTVQNDGLVSIGGGLSGGVNIGGSLTASTGGQVIISGPLGGLNVGSLNLNGGRVAVGGDVTAASSISSLSVTNNGLLAFSRDVPGLTVNGNVVLGSGGKMVVGRNLSSLQVNGDIRVSSGGGIVVGGNLKALTVEGAFQGQGSATNTDLNVGLSLDDLNVQGGGADQGGIQNANIAVGKNIQGLAVAHGIFNSLISAGVTISGTGTSGSAAGTVGADGPDAVLDSQITAGISIINLTLNGNVRSEFATSSNPTGYPTRIVAGLDRAGNYLQGGLIDNFQITGSLIDSVLAASVAPFGGNGSKPTSGYNVTPVVPVNTPGSPNSYDAPAGVTQGGNVSGPISYPNYTENSYYNETFTNVAWNTAIDPNIHDTILLGGAINPSFASTPLSQSQLANSNATTQISTPTAGGGSTTTFTTTTLTLPLPTKSTVLGGVISNTHSDQLDFAGLLADDTRGVFIGALPKQ